MNFNSSQLKAVKHGKGPMLVIAGPGSGKTTVLTMRIKNLIEEHKVNPGEILVITFTKAAALEMENRFNRLVGEKTRVTFGTFHAVFFSILKAAYNYSVDNIIRPEKKQQIIRQAIEKSNLEAEDINDLVSEIEAEISRVKSEKIDINVYYSASCPEEEFRSIYQYYDRELRSARLIDFDDMLLYCYALLKERADILARWQKRYQYILVDEFQDINRIQYEVVKMLAAPLNNLFIVGDDDQSIYGFRGSKPEIMLNFAKDYSDTKTVVLDTNYRSTRNITDAAELVIRNNKVRFDKKIKTVNPEGEKVGITEFDTMYDEYGRIISNIRKGINDGKNYGDYAVLFRTNAIAAPLVRKFVENNIPFTSKDGVPNVFEHWIARDFFAYFELALGSRKRSVFLQVMNRPLRYISRDYLGKTEVSFEELLQAYDNKDWMCHRVAKMKADLEIMAGLTPFAAMNYLRKGVDYDGFIREYAKEHRLEEKELVEVMDEIMESARNFKTYSSWKEYIADYTEKLHEKQGRNKKDYDAVTLTTMHSSKGLEYDTVFIIDANEEITPHKKAVFDADIEEERRMFYVAMTRAKKQLCIFYANKRYNKEMEPSRFVKEIMEGGKSEPKTAGEC